MKKTDLQALLKKHTADDVIDYTGLTNDVNADNDVVIDKKVKAAVEAVDMEAAKKTGVEEFLKKVEIKDETAFEAFVKNTKSAETDLQKKATKLETDNKDLLGKVEELTGSVGTLTSSKTYLERLNTARTAKDINVNPEFVDFVVTKVGGNLKEDEKFEDSFKEFMKDNPQYGETQPRRTIGTPIGTPPPVGTAYDEEMLESMWGGAPPVKPK